MAHDPCMFCGLHPCECAGKKTSGIKRKSLPKTEPVAEVKAEKSVRVNRTAKPQPLQPARPSLKPDTHELDPELQKVLQAFNYHDMLHPTEVKKYERYLTVPKTTGRLVELERQAEGGDQHGDEHEEGGGQ